jgi:hypothetical protein
MLAGRALEALAACREVASSLDPGCLGRHLHHEAHKLTANTALAIATALRTPDLVAIATATADPIEGNAGATAVVVAPVGTASADAAAVFVVPASTAGADGVQEAVTSASADSSRSAQPVHMQHQSEQPLPLTSNGASAPQGDAQADDKVGDRRAVHGHPYSQPRTIQRVREERKAAKRAERKTQAPRGHAPPTMWQGSAGSAGTSTTLGAEASPSSHALDGSGPVATVARVVTVDPVYAAVVSDLRARWTPGVVCAEGGGGASINTDDEKQLSLPRSDPVRRASINTENGDDEKLPSLPSGDTRSDLLRRDGIIVARVGLDAVATVLKNTTITSLSNAAEHAEVLELQSALFMCTCVCVAADSDSVDGDTEGDGGAIARDEGTVMAGVAVAPSGDDGGGVAARAKDPSQPVCECGAVAAAVDALCRSVATGARESMGNVCNTRRPQLDREARLRELLDQLGMVRQRWLAVGIELAYTHINSHARTH